MASSILSACSSDRCDSYIAARSYCTSFHLSCLLSAFDIPIALLIRPQVVLICPRAPTSQVRGITVHPALLHCVSRALYLAFFRVYASVRLSSHGEVSSSHITVFSLSENMTPSGRLSVVVMCAGNGAFFRCLPCS